ncbi:MAG: hypothetical protein P8Y63_07110 [Deltaproteobacteria bacterium]|jgi:hypothetical protein
MNDQGKRYPIAIVAAKVKKRLRTATGKWNDPSDLNLEVSKTWIGALFIVSALIGVGGVICLINGLIKTGGPLALMRGWLAALFGS